MRKNLLFLVGILSVTLIFGQSQMGNLSGNFQLDAQTYNEDTEIGATEPAEKMLMNSYANFTYTQGKFTAGVRFEGFMNTLQGFDLNKNAVGLPYRYLQFQSDEFEITVGNFYDQFGNGLIFRAYEEKALDYDNAIDGIRVKYKPFKGVYLKALAGQQRDYFGIDASGISKVYNKGLVRGLDGEVQINDLLGMENHATLYTLGGSFISKFQEGDLFEVNIGDTTNLYKMPENVGAYSARFGILHKGLAINAEYANKMNDPSPENNYIYKNGESFLLNASYSQKGLGVFLTFKRVDNMSYRSDRNAELNRLNINSLPPISKNYTYSLMAMYPYATQPLGEIGFQAEIIYKFKKKSLLGGKYGTNVSVNYSEVNSLEKTAISDDIELNESWTNGYESSFLAFGDELYFRDFNIEINKKISKKWKTVFLYQNLFYNFGVLRGEPDHEDVEAHVAVADITYKFKAKKAIRGEFQILLTEQDKGDWALGLLELSLAPHWFFTVLDQYNYGNPDNQKVHYYNFSVAYAKHANRIQIGYGKQREGIMCVGGVCRQVPAANGLTISITSSF